VIQGIESPWVRSRSIVTVTVKNDNAAEAFTAAFLKSRESGDIDQSVSILNPGGFTSYRLGNKSYQVGSLSWWSDLRYRLREFPWLIVLLTFTLGLIVVPWTRAKLDQRQRARLASEQA
jgi:hypothetical protein